MSTEIWLVIPRWNDFQHPDTTRTGHMPWVKNFTRLLSSDDYLGLSFPQRGLLHGLWLEYARSRGSLRLRHGQSTLSLSRRLGQVVKFGQLEALNQAGFIEFSASNPASTLASSSASSLQAQKRRDVEEKRPEKNNPVTETVVQLPVRPPVETEGGSGSGDKHLGELLKRAEPGSLPF